MLDMQTPNSLSAIQEVIRSYDHVSIIGRGTKRQSIQVVDEFNQTTEFPEKPVPWLSLREWSGIVEYNPSEFTITARSGTTLQELDRTLAAHGQYMPFDPPLVDQGATLGGAIASGISGPCRLRYGGMRDFVLNVRFVDGSGKLITAGGKVVKNAAGFDIPKLLVGSWGDLGVLTEVTLKVLPRPHEYRSIKIDCCDLKEAISVVQKLSQSSIEIDGLDIDETYSVLVRVGGNSRAAQAASERIVSHIERLRLPHLTCNKDAELWKSLSDWNWHHPGDMLIRAPITHRKILESGDTLRNLGIRIRYSVAGNLAWLSLPFSIERATVDAIFHQHKLSGRVLRSPYRVPTILGAWNENSFIQRIRQGVDPITKFVAV
jgi:glycolate oxidase FAD binding subunit